MPPHLSSVPIPFPSTPRLPSGLALGAALAALHTLGEITPAPLFKAAFFYLSWLWLPFLLLSAVSFCRTLPLCFPCSSSSFPGFFCTGLRSVSGLLRYLALLCTSLYCLGSSSMLPLFPFGLGVLFCLGRISGPSATGYALWAESVAFWVFCAPFHSLSRTCLLAPRGRSSSASLLLLVLSSSSSSGGSFLLRHPCYSSSGGFPICSSVSVPSSFCGFTWQCFELVLLLISPQFPFSSSGSLLLFCFGRRLPTFLYVIALPALEGSYFSGVCSLSHGLLGVCLAPPLVSSPLSLFSASCVRPYRPLLLVFLRLRPCVCSSSPPS